MKKLGSITRTGQNYVSFIPTGEAKAIRLKGSMFKQDSDYKQLVNEFKSIGTKKQLSPDQAKKNEATIERLKKVRGDFFKSLYEPKQKQVRRFGPKKAQPKIKINVEQPRQEPLKEPAIKGTGQQSKPKQQNEEQPKQLEQQVLSKAPAAQDKKADSGKNSNPVISAFSKIATGVKADFFIIKINHLLSAQNALLLKIGSLNMFKEGDIKKKHSLSIQLYMLMHQIEILKAQQEQTAQAELIKQHRARYQNSGGTAKPKWV